MTFDEMNHAVEDAEKTMRFADRTADRLAHLLIGRLRKVSSGYTLKRLKLELRDFNAHTERWSE
jgi:hypothetical protein